ncbi:Os01g0628950 [Oryza sativa Japonica Group]|uniref:Os01g0628950 protein n=1 Tax=Oryza sativa subsp. japonica TaxID=39947 RepID=A0A0P0V5I4_ORYSJ|nr:hypothetical protein EE612_004494 [Oryza sativa]BAS73274.1 Os01g0628950 [Oryza sativa Japonica Group]
MLSAILASSNAKFWPTQIRGPQLKGTNAGESLDALETPSANLSGLNSPTSSPHTSGSWWMPAIGNANVTPGGYVTPPSSVSSYASRPSSRIGGYSLRTSCNIMVTYGLCPRNLDCSFRKRAAPPPWHGPATRGACLGGPLSM